MDLYKNLEWQKSHAGMKLVTNLDYDPASIWEIPAISGERMDLPFYVQEVGITKGQREYYVYRENLDSVIIGYTTEGEMEFEFNGCHSFAPEGSLMWIDCRRPHMYKTKTATESVTSIFVHCWGSGVRELTEYFLNLCPSGQVDCKGDHAPYHYLNRILQLYNRATRTALTDYQALSYLSSLLLEILDLAKAQNSAVEPEYIQSIRTYFDKFFYQKITLRELSEKYFVSEAYLQKQFKKYVGSSPSNYLKQLRIEKSKQLLRTTNRSIAEIAEMVGFQDTSYYISVFKSIEAITPLAYKKMWSYGSISDDQGTVL